MASLMVRILVKKPLISMRFLYMRALPLLALSFLLLLPTGCKTTYESDLVVTYFTPFKRNKKRMQKVTPLMKEINERNHTIEDSQQWLAGAYQSLKIQKLNDIPREEYTRYKGYAGKYRRIHIIVHPAYYTFFGDEEQTNQLLFNSIKGLKAAKTKTNQPFSGKNFVDFQKFAGRPR